MTMKVFKYPSKESWPELCARPAQDPDEALGSVRRIVQEVRRSGDAALKKFTRRFDGCSPELEVTPEEADKAAARVPDELKNAIETAGANIAAFHRAQESSGIEIETFPGVVCGTRKVPIANIGVYIPGGSAPLVSTVLMLAIPAAIAGCERIVMCTPPKPDGSVDSTVLYAARRFGVTDIFRAGGAQAIAAMAYGTETVPKIDKLFGPGNSYVTLAKMQAAADGVAIDMPAGPSEVAVIADDSCDPAFVAADLLAQAEHGPDSQVMLIALSERVIDEVFLEVKGQITGLPRKELAAAALENSRAVLFEQTSDAVSFANSYASEHLVIATRDAEEIGKQITNAGSIFIGDYSCESAGDYASGTNHTLPTNGSARAFSGVSLDSFRKQITYQKLTREGIAGLGPAIETLAEAEGLQAHRNAVSVRLARIASKETAGGRDAV